MKAVAKLPSSVWITPNHSEDLPRHRVQKLISDRFSTNDNFHVTPLFYPRGEVPDAQVWENFQPVCLSELRKCRSGTGLADCCS